MGRLNRCKYYLAIFFAGVICFASNIASQNSLTLSLINTLIVTGILITLWKFLRTNFEEIHPLFIVLIGTVPLFNVSPININASYTALVITILFFFFLQFRFKPLWISLIILLILLGNFFAGEIITAPLTHFNQNRTIFSIKEIPDFVEDFQEEALFLPFKSRPIVYNLPSAYLYQILQKAVGFLSLENLYSTLLLANLYPLVLGIRNLKFSKSEKVLFIGSLLSMIVGIGISRSPNTFGSFILISPLLFYLITIGLSKVNKKIYIALLVFSFILLTSPAS